MVHSTYTYTVDLTFYQIPIYLYMKDESPRTLQGCIEILCPDTTQKDARIARTSPSTLKLQRSIPKITFTSSTFKPNHIIHIPIQTK
jgi:hypothetical protein